MNRTIVGTVAWASTGIAVMCAINRESMFSLWAFVFPFFLTLFW